MSTPLEDSKMPFTGVTPVKSGAHASAPTKDLPPDKPMPKADELPKSQPYVP